MGLRLEWIAHGANAALLGRPQQRPQHLRKQVRVFVGIEMGQRQSRGLQLSHLRRRFGRNLLGGETVAQRGAREAGKAGTECVPIGQRRNLRRQGDGRKLDQVHVAADGELRKRAGKRDGLLELGTAGHQGCRGDHAALVGFAMARLTPRVSPKSSALMMSRFIPQAV